MPELLEITEEAYDALANLAAECREQARAAESVGHEKIRANWTKCALSLDNIHDNHVRRTTVERVME